MNTLILYDSLYGNTEKIANKIGETLGAKVTSVIKIDKKDLKDVDLLIVGSPTQAGRATPDLRLFLKDLPEKFLSNCRAAAFDTRFDMNKHGFGLKLVMGVLNFAAPKIAKALKDKGATLVAPAMGFIVRDTKGPLGEEELKKAEKWAKEVKGYVYSKL